MPIFTTKTLVIMAGTYRLVNSLRIYTLKPYNRRTAGIFGEENYNKRIFQSTKILCEKWNTRERWLDCGVLSWLVASRIEMPCQCLEFCSWTGTTVKLAKTSYDYVVREDRRFIKNWRPISLLTLVHSNQNGLSREGQ